MSFPDGSVVKNPPELQETQVWSLAGGDPLEKEMATHSSVLSWQIPWTEEPGGLQFMVSQKLRHGLPKDVDDIVHRNIICNVAKLETMQLYIHNGTDR